VIFRNYDSGAEVFNSNNGKLKIKRKIKWRNNIGANNIIISCAKGIINWWL
jgi:hypothetical protein